VPLTSAAFAGSVAAPSVVVSATVGVLVDTTFQCASTAFTVTVTLLPAVCELGVPVLPFRVPGTAVSPGSSTCSFVAAPTTAVMLPLVPVRLDASVAVTVWTVPATLLTVNVTVAWPLLSVFVVGAEKLPPFVLDHVMVRPAVFTELLDASASCAVIVTVPPSVTELALEVTRYLVAAPAVIVSLAALPEMFVPPIFAVMLALPVLAGAV